MSETRIQEEFNMKATEVIFSVFYVITGQITPTVLSYLNKTSHFRQVIGFEAESVIFRRQSNVHKCPFTKIRSHDFTLAKNITINEWLIIDHQFYFQNDD